MVTEKVGDGWVGCASECNKASGKECLVVEHTSCRRVAKFKLGGDVKRQKNPWEVDALVTPRQTCAKGRFSERQNLPRARVHRGGVSQHGGRRRVLEQRIQRLVR